MRANWSSFVVRSPPFPQVIRWDIYVENAPQSPMDPTGPPMYLTNIASHESSMTRIPLWAAIRMMSLMSQGCPKM